MNLCKLYFMIYFCFSTQAVRLYISNFRKSIYMYKVFLHETNLQANNITETDLEAATFDFDDCYSGTGELRS